MENPVVSVIIPAYNSLGTIDTTIQHISRQTKEADEVIIVDSSPKEVQEKLSSLVKKYQNVKTVFLDNKTIPAIGRNIGAKHAIGDLLLFIDSDAYPADDWISVAIDSYKTGCLVGGGSIDLPPFQKGILLAESQFYLQFNEFLSFGSNRRKDFVPSCNLFCEKSLFYSLGGFPEMRASEDVCFGLKAIEENDLWFLPAMKVYHIFGLSWKRFRSNQFLLGKYVAIYRKQKMKSALKHILFSPFFLIPVFMFIPVYKYVLLLKRVLHTDPQHIFRFLVVSPSILYGLLIWSTGFLNGAVQR